MAAPPLSGPEGTASPAAAWVRAAPADAALRERYEAYCRAQAAELPRVLPRKSVRPLYRAARAAAVAEGGDLDDPLELLEAFCRRILPLPPYREWAADYRRNPAAYRDLPGSDAGAPTPDEPLTAALATVDLDGEEWIAGLHLYRDAEAWRGWVGFHRPGDADAGERDGSGAGGRTRLLRTGEVFREGSAEEVLERFRTFAPETLRAFLRSVLP